jgi:hypothetical protein
MSAISPSPVRVVKERFESKEKLVAAVEKLAGEDLWLDRINAKKGLGRVSNGKLVRLFDLLSLAKKQFGSRAKLIDAILALENKPKDQGYRGKLEHYPLPRLLDLHSATEKRSKRTEAAKAPVAGKPKPKPKPKAAPKKGAAKTAASQASNVAKAKSVKAKAKAKAKAKKKKN